MRFIGNIEAKSDSKGRIFVPAGFRRTVQTGGATKLMMRKDIFQDCLVLYPEESWNEQLNTLRIKLDRWNSQHQMIFRQFVADVEEINIDSNGRILIPKRYLKMAGIIQEVRFIGMDDTIEIWAKEKLEQPFMDAATFGNEIEGIMSEKQKEEHNNG